MESRRRRAEGVEGGPFFRRGRGRAFRRTDQRTEKFESLMMKKFAGALRLGRERKETGGVGDASMG